MATVDSAQIDYDSRMDKAFLMSIRDQQISFDLTTSSSADGSFSVQWFELNSRSCHFFRLFEEMCTKWQVKRLNATVIGTSGYADPGFLGLVYTESPIQDTLTLDRMLWADHSVCFRPWNPQALRVMDPRLYWIRRGHYAVGSVYVGVCSWGWVEPRKLGQLILSMEVRFEGLNLPLGRALSHFSLPSRAARDAGPVPLDKSMSRLNLVEKDEDDERIIFTGFRDIADAGADISTKKKTVSFGPTCFAEGSREIQQIFGVAATRDAEPRLTDVQKMEECSPVQNPCQKVYTMEEVIPKKILECLNRVTVRKLQPMLSKLAGMPESKLVTYIKMVQKGVTDPKPECDGGWTWCPMSVYPKWEGALPCTGIPMCPVCRPIR